MYTGKILKTLFLLFYITLPVKIPDKILFFKPKAIKKIKNKKGRKKSKFLFTENETLIIKENYLFEYNLLKGIILN